MHFKIKVSIYLGKEAKEKPAIPQSNTARSWPLVLPSTRLPAAISRCPEPSGFKGSSRGNRSPRFRGPAGRGTAPLGKGGRGAEIHRRGQSAQRQGFKGFPKADFYQDCQGRSEGVTFQLGGMCFCCSDARFARGSQVSWVSGWISGAGVAIKVSIRLISSPAAQAAEFHPPIKLSVILEHFCELK